MRNLKRALSLGLTAAMISGLMVMGSSAASSSYTDVADTDNVEAIEVLKAVGIMVGDENGDFNPDENVTRNEMAVVMSNLMAYNVATYKDTSPFTDVPSWAEPYVAACYTNKITAGTSATTYGGSENVTTAQAALMLLKALGYFQYSSDFGSDWQLATVSQGNKIDLFDDVDSGVREAMTRNDLAQLVLNTLESGTVEAEKTGQDISVGDITITSGVTYKYVTSGKDYAYAINDKLATYTDGTHSTGAIVELGEKLYQGDLTKDEDQDDFGRPANIWEYQAKEVGTYADEADYTFTAKVTSKNLYNTVGKTAAENYDWSVYVNGEEVKGFSNDKLVDNKADDDADFNVKLGGNKLTGNGVITEVFVDGTKETVKVAVIHQYAAEVLSVDKEDGTITLSDLANKGPADAKDEFKATGLAEDDIVIYTYANDKIQSVYAAQKISGDVTSVRVNTDANADGKVTDEGDGDNFVVDGTTYKYNYTMNNAEKLETDNVNNGVVAYLDAQGYVAYIDESAVTYDYAYVLSMGTDSDKYGKGANDKGTTVYARLVLTDGTMVSVETDNKKSEIGAYDSAKDEYTAKDSTASDKYLLNHIVSYSKDKNGVYSLTDRSGEAIELVGATLDVNNDKASFQAGGTYVANANTVFIVADPDPDSYNDYDFTVYTGVKNVPDIDGNSNTKAVVAVRDTANSNVAKVVYIEDADVSGNGEVIFARADTNPNYTKDQDGKVYEIKAYVDGSATTLKVREGSSAAKALVTNIDTGSALKLSSTKYLVALKSVTTNSDGYVTSVRLYDENALTGDKSGVLIGTGIADKSKDDIVTLTKPNGDSSNYSYTWTDKVVVAQFNDKNNKNEFNSSKMSSIKQDNNDMYIAVLDEGVITGICTVYVEGAGESSDTVSKGGVTATASVSGTGTVSVVFDVDRPEYVPNTATAQITADLYIDGVYEGTIGTASMGGTLTLASEQNSARWSSRGYDAENVATIDKDSIQIKYSDVKVQYIDKSNNGDVILSSGSTSTVKVGNSVSLSGATVDGRAYTSTSIDAATAAIKSGATGSVTVTDSTGVITGSGLNVTGDGYVVVEITGLVKDTAMHLKGFSATALSSAPWNVTSENMTLAVTPKTTSVSTGSRVDFDVTTAVGISVGANEGYRVVIEKLGFDKVFTGAKTESVTITVNGDVAITPNDVKITPVTKFAFVDGSWTKNTIVLNFNQEVDEKTLDAITEDVTTTFNGTVDIDSRSANGKQVTITLKNGELDGTQGKIKVATGLKDIYGVAIAATDVNIQNDGTVSK